MKVYHIADQYGRNLDLYEWQLYENSDPVYSEDKDYLEELIVRIHKERNFDGLHFHVVTTIMEDKDLKSVDLF